ncbi:hypothetical protein KSS87_016550 [Heliosperma pusillum]|nr:hypothetical protein KSS87_016550 [Heliosperma pusillum]
MGFAFPNPPLPYLTTIKCQWHAPAQLAAPPQPITRRRLPSTFSPAAPSSTSRRRILPPPSYWRHAVLLTSNPTFKTLAPPLSHPHPHPHPKTPSLTSQTLDLVFWKVGLGICSCRYKKMETCISPYPSHIAGEQLKPFPERLYAIPPRVSSGSIPGVTADSYSKDSSLWKKHVKAYKRINSLLDTGRYRNIMDMNAGLGGFAAAIQSSKLWVMNVVPTIAEKNTLGVVYERGLTGIYHDWCEGFSTYPRTYDLIHANGLFSLYDNKCNLEDILLEMDRILRPEGAVIIRDEVDVLVKVKKTVAGMRWETRMVDHEDGPLVPEKILVAVKQYWTLEGNTTTSQ